MEKELLHKELTNKIIKSFYNVHFALGYGFLEKVYENALAIELAELGFSFEQQKTIKVFYKSRPVGDYKADFIIDNKVILELKACESIAEEHEFQLINYLKATDIQVGLLLNFGKKAEFKRKIFTNTYKN